MKKIVIDASMAAAWTLNDEKTEKGDNILDKVKRENPITTTLFWYEYRNILLVNQKRGRVRTEQFPAMLQQVRALAMKEYSIDDDNFIINLAFQYNLSAYDAAYLALALREKAILATNDKKLVQAARAAGLGLRTAIDEVGQ